jgi:hypothetical protein
MWRVRLPDGRLSDLLNRTRAEELARRLDEKGGPSAMLGQEAAE